MRQKPLAVLVLCAAAGFAMVATHGADPAVASGKSDQKAKPARLTSGIFHVQQLPGLVIDDAQAQVTGEWTKSAAVAPFVGQGYLHDGNKEQGKKSVRFEFNVPESGQYDVRIAYTAATNRATNATVTVHAAGGEKKLMVNQRETPAIGGALHLLGTFAFEAGKPGAVVVSNEGADGHVIADAVQVVNEDERKIEIARPAPAIAAIEPKLPPPAKVDPNVLANIEPKTPKKVAEPKKTGQPKTADPKIADANKTEPKKADPKPEPKKEEPKPEIPKPEPDVFVQPVANPNFTRLTPAELDTLLDQHVKGGVKDQIDDEQFIRRVSLDLIGRQPNAEELTAWRADNSPSKRAQLIEKLLASEEYGRNWANYWSDTISYRTPPPELTYLKWEPLEGWLADKINRNYPWDEITRRILTASGKVGDYPPATFVGYHQGDATRLAAETARIFLSQQIRCAECHDHPFDHWKRIEFHQLTAFFARAGAKLPWRDGPATVVSDRGKGEHVMPNAADPKKKGQVMTPKFMSDEAPVAEGAPDKDRRQALSKLIADANNPWFAKAYVNRIWARLMGRGFYEPVDDMADHNEQLLPEVHEALAESFAASGFDMKHLFRLITNTKAYQRRLRMGEKKHGDPAFAAAATARLRGDEVFDSLYVVLKMPIVTPPETPPTDAIRFPPPPQNIRDRVADVFGFDPSLQPRDIPRTMAQAMLLMNNVEIQAQVKATPDSGTELAKLLAANKDDKQAIEKLFEKVLARKPTEGEVKIALGHIESVGARSEAFEDILWGLLNSAEFTTRK